MDNKIKSAIVYSGVATSICNSYVPLLSGMDAKNKTLKEIQSPRVCNRENIIYSRKYQCNDIKYCIARATQKALVVLQKSKKSIALEEEAMLPHHCSFIKLSSMAFSVDVCSICVYAVLHKKESSVGSTVYNLILLVSVACASLMFFNGVSYCYERFYYRQREAYPQRYIPSITSLISSFLLFYTHSEKSRYSPKLKYYLYNLYLTENKQIQIKLVTVLTLLQVFLAVTIAHTNPAHSITIIPTMEVL
ncbi:MAG: hypothetical protein N3F66_05580 [Spirochaetes bacterium]|nr:hypothetical protein [Spirochaetota bacterium]